MNHFRCACGNVLFFENTACLQCGHDVGYDLSGAAMRIVDAPFTRCKNGTDFGACNWLVTAGTDALCPACSLNRTVPDLSRPDNLHRWRKMESAKRRVIYTLSMLGLAPSSKSENPDGLVFDFLSSTPENSVVTGHKAGVITLNILEADDVYRERERNTLGEPYRTLVGHFRHELGHYHWDKFFAQCREDDSLLAEFRTLFGDEREDYAAALARYYANGPAPAWASTHISAYATSHPWEDWAETWAQYLHIVDGAETARAFGWVSERIPLPFTPFSSAEIQDNASASAGADFLKMLNGWARLAPALNELAASLGHPTLYPFVLSTGAVRKIVFVNKVVGVATNKSKSKAAA